MLTIQYMVQGCNVIGYKDSNGEYHINPDANQKLIPGSKIIVLGKSKQIQNLNRSNQLLKLNNIITCD